MGILHERAIYKRGEDDKRVGYYIYTREGALTRGENIKRGESQEKVARKKAALWEPDSTNTHIYIYTHKKHMQ